MRELSALDFARRFYKGEVSDHAVYTALARREKNRDIRAILVKLARVEEGHKRAWRKLAEEQGAEPKEPALLWLRVIFFVLIRKFFGIAFTVKLLERNEAVGLAEYRSVVHRTALGKKWLAIADGVIRDESEHERMLLEKVEQFSKSLHHVSSIVFGLNDGIVEVLAAVAGLAILATTPTIVSISGIIVALSGTLSMTAGAYLSAKSQNLVEEGTGGNVNDASPSKSAFYTGVFYFIGALIPVSPFIFHLSGLVGILVAVLLCAVALSIVSFIIATLGNSNAKKRIAEMLIISIGAAMATMLVGAFVRVYLKITI
ncbi:MAG: VIT1/CCC1 transporter family protein [Candidatus Micrarchaeia archaeon]